MTENNLWKLLFNRLEKDLDPKKHHGQKAEFCRVTGFARTKVDRWLTGESVPGVDELEAISKWFGLQPWELIKPDAALPTVTPTEEQLLAMVKERDVLIKNLESQLQNSEAKVVENPELLNRILAVWGTFNENQRRLLAENAEAFAARINPANQSIQSVSKHKKAGT